MKKNPKKNQKQHLDVVPQGAQPMISADVFFDQDVTVSQQPSILLIESNPKEIDHYSDLIREVVQCRIDVMNRAGSSLEWIEKSDYDLAVIDFGKKNGDAQERLSVLEKIKRVSPKTSVILMADDVSVDEAVAAIRLGAEDYFKKPFRPETFKLAIKRGLDRNVVFSDEQGAGQFLSLINTCQMISASLEEGKIFKILQGHFSRELHSAHSAFYLQTQEGVKRIPVDTQDSKSDQAVDEMMDIALHALNPFEKMVESGEMFRFIERSQLTPSLFIFRFKCSRDQDYFFISLSPQKPPQMEVFESRLRMLKTQIEVTGKNIAQYQGVESLVYMDDATGLYNTRYLNNVLDKEIAQAEQSGKSFAILFIDADKFKSVNDQHGHLVGTSLLNELGAHLKGLVRDKDTVFRYGGDEFIAVLTSCDLSTATAVAERMRESVEKKGFINEEGVCVKVTISIGVALYPDHARSKKAVIEKADKAMYEAKKKSRNCVYVMPLDPSH